MSISSHSPSVDNTLMERFRMSSTFFPKIILMSDTAGEKNEWVILGWRGWTYMEAEHDLFWGDGKLGPNTKQIPWLTPSNLSKTWMDSMVHPVSHLSFQITRESGCSFGREGAMGLASDPYVQVSPKAWLHWRLTVVDVGSEGEGAVLDVKGEGVDLQVTGANHSDRVGVSHYTSVLNVHIRDDGSSVFIHTVKQGEIGGRFQTMGRI